MAQWNPYLGVPEQNNLLYDNPNVNPQSYYNVQSLPYGSVPLQQLNYNNYYASNSGYSNNFQAGTVYNAHELEAQQFSNFNTNSVPTNSTSPSTSFENGFKELEPNNIDSAKMVNSSNLTATAAEFKPSFSQQSSSINSQTFYNNRHTNNKGAIRKHNNKEVKNGEVAHSETSSSTFNDPSSSNKSVNARSNTEENRKYYSRNNTNYNYNKSQNKNYNRNYKRDEMPSNEAEAKPSFNKRQNDYSRTKSDTRFNRDNFSRNRQDFSGNSSQNDGITKQNTRYNDYNSYKSENKYYKKYDNRENAHGRNYRENLERSNNFSRDNYNKTGKYSYRNNKNDNSYENWRSTSVVDQQSDKKMTEKDDTVKYKSHDKERKTYNRINEKEDDISQRDRLTEQVNRGTLECLVCCERVRQADKTWHCQKCYHIFHFRCILRWGTTSKDDNGWRCPACQHVCTEIPSGYFCYCGKVSEPSYNPSDTAHSCGDVCGRVGIKPGCTHNCNLLCHPGPCPKCEALVSRNCNCGATTQMVKCSADTVLVCNAICSKLLNCQVHTCEKICHGGDCDKCLETIPQVCHCGKETRTIPCSKHEHNVKEFCCEKVCEKILLCGNHKCQEICHPGDCPPCVRAPDQVKTCPCGKSQIQIARTSCLDLIPCCEKICGKKYPLCGTTSEPHICQSVCHEDACPPCSLNSLVRCRCGHMSKEIACKELVSGNDIRCEKKCTKKRTCGKHKCNQLCCIDIDHICPLPCTHTLTCGLHRCEQTCHKGRCQPCWRTSFEELYCECGASVIYPPIPCGTKRPHCTRPCTRRHECQHEALHTCHSMPECPPCTVLTTKVCYGGHEKRTTIPCHQKEFSCGLPCGKELSCGRHKCQLPCHKGSCLKEGQSCTQSCTITREACGHPCGLPCHEMPCPESPCKEMVKVTCECGLRSSSRACVDMTGEYQRIATSMLASKMADMQLGHSIDIVDIVGTTARRQTLKTLECNDECRLVERNRRLAIGLQIRNPDLSAKLTPRYSDFMRTFAKKDRSFSQVVHDRLTELVQLAKQSKQKSRSYSFPSANREKRQFIHEYCEHFGCESAAYDAEPNRNVVATAVRDKAWLPSCSLLQLLQRENGQRKVPGPILNRPLGGQKPSDTVSLKIPINASIKSSSSASNNNTNTTTTTPSTSFSNAVQRPKTPETDIDYFNFPPL